MSPAKDLNWFWQAWYYQNGGIPDLAISQALKRKTTAIHLSLKTRADFPLTYGHFLL
jgi:hypothetical protein